MTSGPIIIVDADNNTRRFYAEVINTIGVPNKVVFFQDGPGTLEYLRSTDEKPFILLSEIGLPGMTGLEMKEIIQKDKFLQEKAIPFVFITIDTSPDSIRKAHRLNVQGYFQKPADLVYVEQLMLRIFEYWELCKHINNS